MLKNRFVFKNFEKGLFTSLLCYTSFIAINIIVDQINGNLGKFLLGRFRGTGEVAIFSVGYSLQHYYAMFSTAISGLFAPKIHRIVNQTKADLVAQKQQLTDVFIRVGRIQFFILALIASGLVFFGKPFVSFWAGAGYEASYYVALLLILPVTIPLIQNIGIEVQRAQNNHHFRSLIYFGMAVINLVLSVLLCQRYGALGASVGTSLSLIIANGIVMNIFYHKRCNIDIIAFWKNIFSCARGLILPVIFGCVIVYFFEIKSFISFATCVVLYAIVYTVSVWLFGLNSSEKQMIMKPIKKVLRGKV